MPVCGRIIAAVHLLVQCLPLARMLERHPETPAVSPPDAPSPSAPAWSVSPRSEALRLALLLAAALALYWIGNARTPLWDRDEPRFAQAAREMLHSGDFLVPRFNGEVRFDKPVLGYLPIAAGMRVFGENEFGARFFSGILGALSVLLTYLLARRMTSRPDVALLSAGILAFAPVMAVESRLATVDSLLLVFMLLAFTALWRIFEGARSVRWPALLWSALALAVLTKGPVALAALFAPLILMALLSRDRSFLRRMGWLWGVPLFLAILAPWLVAVQVRTAGEFLRIALGKHVLGRAAEPLEGHSGFPGFYLAALFLTFFPFVFFLPVSLKLSLKGLRDKPREVFLLSWAAGLILVLEFVRTKMVHYSLPAFPALSILVACAVAQGRDTRFKCEGRCPSGPVLAATITGFAFAVAAPIAVWRVGLANAVVPLAAAGMILVTLLLRWLYASPNWRGIWWGVTAGALWLFVIAAWAAPELGAYGASRPLAALVAHAKADLPAGESGKPAPLRVALYGYDEPSLIFYLGGGVDIPAAPLDVAALAAPGAPDVLVVNRRLERLTSLLDASPARRVGDVRGFNFAKGRFETVSVYASPSH